MGSADKVSFGKGKLQRREFLTLLGAGAAALATGCISLNKQGTAKRPNIVIILADDLGYNDVGFQGSKEIPTPNIDSIARNGVRFTNGYVSAPLCSPTRAGLMTGRYQQRFGHELNLPEKSPLAGPEDGMPLSETTIADDLKADGYATGMVGKWHLGYQPKFHPLQRGFQEFFGFLSAYRPYVSTKPSHPDPVYRGMQPIQEKEYLTEAFTREAISFIDRHSQEPFFLYLAFNAVHHPYQAPHKYLDRFPNIADEKRRTYAAMTSAMDDGIGSVLGELEKQNLTDNTLVIFLSDNGGVGGNGDPADNAPLRATKSTVYEGGIRVPFVMQWPEHFPKGQTYNHPITSLDLRATAMAVSGAKTQSKKPLDGINLIPYITGEKTERPHEMLFWGIGGKTAVRRGNWKLVQVGDKPKELYDLANDLQETNNVADRNPEVTKELNAALQSWGKELAEPLLAGRKGVADHLRGNAVH